MIKRTTLLLGTPLLLSNMPPLPPPPLPTDHVARCRVHDVVGAFRDVTLNLKYDWRNSGELGPVHTWQIDGNRDVFPVGDSKSMKSTEDLRYTSSDLMLPADIFPEVTGDTAVAFDGPLPRNSSKAFTPDDQYFHYNLEFNMRPEIYYKRTADQGFLTGFSEDNGMGLHPKFIGFCNITSTAAVKP